MKYNLSVLIVLLTTFSCTTPKNAYILDSNINNNLVNSTVLILKENTFEIKDVVHPIHSNDIISVERKNSGIVVFTADKFTLLSDENNEVLETYYFGDSTKSHLYKYSEIIDSTGRMKGLIKGVAINQMEQSRLKDILNHHKQ